MTDVSIASLGVAIDASAADLAAQQMDRATAAAARLEAATDKLELAQARCSEAGKALIEERQKSESVTRSMVRSAQFEHPRRLARQSNITERS